MWDGAVQLMKKMTGKTNITYSSDIWTKKIFAAWATRLQHFAASTKMRLSFCDFGFGCQVYI